MGKMMAKIARTRARHEQRSIGRIMDRRGSCESVAWGAPGGLRRRSAILEERNDYLLDEI
jgi:hypothetical protein